jgi:coenzyme Q-binding protein COQ10
MPHIHLHRELPYPVPFIFELVAQVEHYPEFLPFCEKLTVLDRRSEGGKEVLHAEMVVGYGWVSERMETVITLDQEAGEILITKAPEERTFVTMEAVWTFRSSPHASHEGVPHDGLGCHTEFRMHCAMQNFYLNAILENVFASLGSVFMATFEKRAATLYEHHKKGLVL